MDHVELFVIEDRFQITGRGVILTPDFSVPTGRWHDRTEKISIAHPNGEKLEATAQMFLTHFSIRDPSIPADKRWRIVVMVTDRKKEELPVGARVFVSPEVRDALAPKA